MPAAAHSEAGAKVVGKAELAEALGWSRPRLDRRLDTDPGFPVASRGDRAGGWEFDVGAVLEHLGVAAAAEPEPEAAEEDKVVVLARAAVHAGEETATQRYKLAQAQLSEDRLRRQRGELVEMGPLRLKLSNAMLAAAARLNALPDVLARRLNLPEDRKSILRQELDEVRRAMVAEIRDLLVDE